MIISYILLSSSPPRKQVHSLPNGFVGNGYVGAHSGFVGVSGDLLDDSGGNAEFEGNAYEGTSGTVGSKELPFRVNFIISRQISLFLGDLADYNHKSILFSRNFMSYTLCFLFISPHKIR